MRRRLTSRVCVVGEVDDLVSDVEGKNVGVFGESGNGGGVWTEKEGRGKARSAEEAGETEDHFGSPHSPRRSVVQAGSARLTDPFRGRARSMLGGREERREVKCGESEVNTERGVPPSPLFEPGQGKLYGRTWCRYPLLREQTCMRRG